MEAQRLTLAQIELLHDRLRPVGAPPVSIARERAGDAAVEDGAGESRVEETRPREVGDRRVIVAPADVGVAPIEEDLRVDGGALERRRQVLDGAVEVAQARADQTALGPGRGRARRPADRVVERRQGLGIAAVAGEREPSVEGAHPQPAARERQQDDGDDRGPHVRPRSARRSMSNAA